MSEKEMKAAVPVQIAEPYIVHVEAQQNVRPSPPSFPAPPLCARGPFFSLFSFSVFLPFPLHALLT